MKLYLLFAIIFLSACAYAQDQKYEISSPLDIPAQGVNKVLCMKSGYTALLHFEAGKAIVVKMFDSSHKEIASQKHSCRYFDITKLQDCTFKGIYDIGNEVTLFMEQERYSKYVLIMLRFDPVTAAITEDKIIGESASMSKRTRFYVIKNNEEDGYSILNFTDIPQFKECRINLVAYNSKHAVVKETPLEVDRKKYDAAEFVGAEQQRVGACITINLKKMQSNETVHSDDVSNGIEVYDNDLCFFYVPADGGAVRRQVVDVTSDVYPYYSTFTYNPFAQSLNMLLLSYREYSYRYGTSIRPGALKASLFLSLQEQDLALKYKWIKNNKANVYYQQQTDTTKLFEGIPVKMFTGDNGLTTVIYRSYDRQATVESKSRPLVYDSYFGNLCITQFDDEGNELWGTVLPGDQFFHSYRHWYFAGEMAKTWQDQALFNDQPEQVYGRQFLLQNVYRKGKDIYIVYNDNEGNFGNSISKPGSRVYEFSTANACYYKMARNKEVTKNHLFGNPVANEYNCSFIEGADFDEKRGVYTALVSRSKNNRISLCMAWSRLE